MSCLRKKISAVAGLCLIFTGAFLFYACGDPKDEGNLAGTWKHQYSDTGSSIVTVSDTNFNYGDPSYPAYDVAGTIEYHTDYSEKSGVIIFKLTTAPAGKYTAAYWKELTDTTVLMSTAINADYSTPTSDTLDAAKAQFALTKAGDWVSQWGGPYTKE